MTFSIVARDPETGSLGVAVQTHWFSVGTAVPWALPGIGAIATQSLTNISFGPDGLRGLAEGRDPKEVLSTLTHADENRDVRQVGIIDASGRSGAFTGAKCIEYANHVIGENFSCQANMMLKDGVPEAMATQWETSADKPFAERLLDCLDAAQAAGGDIRGMQSTALRVVSGEREADSWEGVDLRVDDSDRPLAELRRLLVLQRAYDLADKGDGFMAENNRDAALLAFQSARELAPESDELSFWHGVALSDGGRTDEAVAVLAPIIARNRNWLELLRRLPASGLANENEQLLELLTETAR